jgi:IgA Peptidase M64/Peptidase M64 N-terminus
MLSLRAWPMGLLITVAVLTAVSGQGPVPSSYDAHFGPGTMRVDYFHTGGKGVEIVSLDRVVADGAWPGSRTQLLDRTNLGPYFFEVIDPTTNQAIYSRGFASLYGEWETTPESKQVHRTFHESLRVPWPKAAVQVVLKKREGQSGFQQIWSTRIDPNSRFVSRAEPPKRGRVWTLLENGPATAKVDLLLISEGYTEAELPKFRADAKRLVDAMFAVEPYKSRKTEFNVRGIDLTAEQSGVHRPQAGQHRHTPISTEYNIFDTERYVLTSDNRALRDVAAAAPYEFIEILVNEKTYGGGGIYNFQATSSVDSAFSEYVFIHEFGHHFAALGDEYYTSPVAYETGVVDRPEPWEPNITALKDPATLKWRDLVTPGTPLPTPWNKEEYEKKSREFQARRRTLREGGAPESEMDALFREQEAWETKFLASMQYSGRVGAFEGASYEARGLYRPEADCIMFTRDRVGFCRVCRRAIDRVIDLYAKP